MLIRTARAGGKTMMDVEEALVLMHPHRSRTGDRA